MSRKCWRTVSIVLASVVIGLLAYLLAQVEMFQRINQLVTTVRSSTDGMTNPNGLPSSWHSGPDDSFHGKITSDGPFQPEKDRYHLYIGLFCPFAHRANLMLHLKQLDKYAGITTSIVKPYPKGDDKGWPGWQFNLADDKPGQYEGATVDELFGSTWMHQLYFRADPEYKGRYSVPVLWDKKLETIVNNESHELLRDLQTAFNSLLPSELAEITLYPEDLRKDIDRISEWMQRDLNSGVYKAGFAPDQATYNKNLPAVFASLNKLEHLAHANGGPYILGTKLTELDVRAYATLIRFDPVYVQHFKCNLGTIRHDYPVLHNWLKGLYWDHADFKNTTDFRHIKDNYTKSHSDINPRGITPLGPWPHIEEGPVEKDWGKLRPGRTDIPEVLQYEKVLEGGGVEDPAGGKGFSLDHFKAKV